MRIINFSQDNCQKPPLNLQVNPMTSNYEPNSLLDALLDLLKLKNDAALARALEVAPPVISKVRHYRLPLGPSLLIRIHEVSGISVKQLQALMGDRRAKYRISNMQGRPKLTEAQSAPASP